MINDFIVEHSLDVLALTETWLTGSCADDPVLSALLPPGYNITHTPRASRGGGTAMVYKQTISLSKVVSTNTWCSFEAIECLLKSSQVARLCVVYRPPSSNDLATFFREFGDYLSHLVTASGHLLLMGDFNFHVDVISDQHAKEFMSLVSSFGLQQHVTGSTHRNGHTLDLVMTPTNSTLVSSCNPLDCAFPDHFPVFVTAALKKPPLPRIEVTYRKLRSVTPEAISEAIHSTGLCDNSLIHSLPLDDLVHAYDHHLRDVMTSLAPEKTAVITLRPEAKWFTDDIRVAKQQRRQAEKRWRKTHLIIHREMYVEERQKVNALIVEAKKNYHREQIAACGNDSKRLFSLTKKLLGRSETTPTPSGDPKDVAVSFSEFFISKISRIRSSIPHEDLQSDMPSSLPREVTTPLNQFVPIDEETLLRIIRQSPTKYCDLDPIPTQWVKYAAEDLCPVMLRIVNASLSQGVFPQCFKTALISPHLKKPSLDAEDPMNYRPISNLSFLSKVLERTVCIQLTDHLNRNDLMEPLQSAYRRNHSTETALLKVTTDIRLAIGRHEVVAMAFLDLSAAFDTVDIEMLTTTLMNLGVTGLALQWLRSYLINREQVVSVKGARSPSEKLVCGVPQGSVLGPVLFSIYTLPLAALLRQLGVQFHQYADDLQLYISTTPEQLSQAVTQLEECIHSVERWMNHHHLKLNSAKTDFTILGSKRTLNAAPTPSLTLGDAVIAPKESVRNIGFIMDQSLSSEDHVASVCRSSYAQLQCLSRIKRFVDKKSLEKMVHAFITSRLDFCNSMLYGMNGAFLYKVQRVQNSCARLLSNTMLHEHITPVLKSLHWLPIRERIVFKILVLVFKCLHGQCPVYIKDFLSVHVSQRPLRDVSSFTFDVPFTRSAFINNTAFNFYAPTLWNNLPLNIRCTQSLDTFKSRLKTYLFSCHFN